MTTSQLETIIAEKLNTLQKAVEIYISMPTIANAQIVAQLKMDVVKTAVRGGK